MNRFIFQFDNDWKQLFNKWNWYAFSFVNVYFEYDKMHEGYFFQITLLGIGFSIRYNTPKSDKIFAKYEKQVADFLKDDIVK